VYEILAAGFLIGLTHAIPPGPITFEVLRRGVTSGFQSALQVNVGAVAADAVFFILISFGLLQVISDPAVRIAIWIGGCALLCFLGLRGLYNTIKKKASFTIENKAVDRETKPLMTGFLICITSPFAIMWWAGVFAGAVGASLLNSQWATYLLMFGGIALACLLWYGAIGFVSAGGKKFFNEKWLRAMSLACSLMMLAFAAILFYRGYMTLL
jgi:threonine/homoserine/homoserine lactone efflux protein